MVPALQAQVTAEKNRTRDARAKPNALWTFLRCCRSRPLHGSSGNAPSVGRTGSAGNGCRGPEGADGRGASGSRATGAAGGAAAGVATRGAGRAGIEIERLTKPGADGVEGEASGG